MQNDVFEKWFDSACKLGSFLVDIGEYELCEVHLDCVREIVAERYADSAKLAADLQAARRVAHFEHLNVILYLRWSKSA